ncbi:MAG: hypothetical protein PHF30_05095 [Bacilli bacterium]|nr:hypothetical protein [Bacilli bacterium]
MSDKLSYTELREWLLNKGLMCVDITFNGNEVFKLTINNKSINFVINDEVD